MQIGVWNLGFKIRFMQGPDEAEAILLAQPSLGTCSTFRRHGAFPLLHFLNQGLGARKPLEALHYAGISRI